ncbi:hypothetical protein LV780_04710 [Cereibacter azotoformans]|uniref:hypothetical protein n=1 Tax=Cereibacter azotoformans TaxID=43057 RepID=UPI000E358DE8|nr:hypothetical protein [Cereibacter azotoformans]AXQ93173.1 hypothetical protein D0Z66_04710 [Cereibacter sphaeroides]UIJ31482.1 hypothetical protein LV780_04710 [Cereibacter azotoformans]
MSTGEHEYFTVEPTACTVPKRGALAIYCGDAPRRIEGGTSFSLRAPLLLIPQDMFADEADIASKVARVLNENSHLFFSSAKPQPQPAGKDDGGGWGWYAGSDGENYHTGPLASRDHAVAALYGEAGYIIEARQDLLPLSHYVDAEDILDRADECADDMKGDGCEPIFEATPEQVADLDARLKRSCDEWQAAHGLRFKPCAFTASRNEAWIEAIDPIDLGEACDAGVVDHA